MTAIAEHDAVGLPLRPTERENPGGNAQYARTRAREPRPGRLSGAAGKAGSMLSGASVIDRPPPAIMTVWAKHAASARFYQGALFRYPRFAFGAWHAFVEVPVLYFLAWAGDSVPKRLAVAAVVFGCLRLLGIHVIWSWL